MFPQKQLSEDTKECHTDCLAWYSSDSEDDFVVEPEKKRKAGSCVNYLSFALYKNYLSQLTLTLTTTPSVNQEPQPSTVNGDCNGDGDCNGNGNGDCNGDGRVRRRRLIGRLCPS